LPDYFLFIVSSAASGAAQGIGQLIVFRVLQGVGAATMMPGTLSLITRAFPARQRGLAIGIWGGVSGLGLIAGPILGGLLVHGDSWRWIFFINLPIGAIALAMAVLFVVESRDEYAPRSIDWPGLGSLSGALFLIMYGFTRANGEGWTSPLILSCFAAGLVLLAAFVYVEQRVRYPLVELALFRSGTFVMACLSALLFSLAVFGTQPYTSLFMQNYWGFTPLQGGFGYLPSTALVALMMPASGIIGQRLGSPAAAARRHRLGTGGPVIPLYVAARFEQQLRRGVPAAVSHPRRRHRPGDVSQLPGSNERRAAR